MAINAEQLAASGIASYTKHVNRDEAIAVLRALADGNDTASEALNVLIAPQPRKVGMAVVGGNRNPVRGPDGRTLEEHERGL